MIVAGRGQSRVTLPCSLEMPVDFPDSETAKGNLIHMQNAAFQFRMRWGIGLGRAFPQRVIS